jgi:hypothetical protein
VELLRGAQQWAECRRAGRYFFSLVADPSWVHRRVETVELISRFTIERRVSLDIDVHDLVKRAEAADYQSPKQVYLPLTLLRKIVLTELDVRDDSGRALCVVTSDRDSHAAHAVVLETARQAGFDPQGFSPALVQKLYDIVWAIPSAEDRTAIERNWHADDVGIEAWSVRSGLTWTAEDQRLWDDLFANETFVARIAELTVKYMPIAAIDTTRASRIVKFRTVEPQVNPLKLIGFREKFGMRPGLFVVDAPSIGRAQREHLRILAPGGTFLSSANLVARPDSGRHLGKPAPQPPGAKYKQRLTLERAVIYSRDAETGPYQVHFGLRPSLREFQAPAIIALLVSSLLLSLGAVGQRYYGTLAKVSVETSEPAVALLLLIPTLAVAYIAREGEHEVRAHLLRWLRYLVGASGFFTIAAAIALVAHGNSLVLTWVWLVGAAYCAVALVVVLGVCAHISRRQKTVLRASDQERDRVILRY